MYNVLIAPLWNWNDKLVEISAEALSSNRTFMELKLLKVERRGERKASF